MGPSQGTAAASERLETLEPEGMVTPQPLEPQGPVRGWFGADLVQARYQLRRDLAGLRCLGADAGPLLSVRDVAAQLGVSTFTVYRLVSSGALPHFRVSNAIRVAPADFEAFLVASRIPGAQRQ